MTLYVVHRAVLGEDMRCRRARRQDREAIEKLLFAMSTRREILADFDLAMDPLRLDLDCLVFESNDAMLGLAILWFIITLCLHIPMDTVFTVIAIRHSKMSKVKKNLIVRCSLHFTYF